MSLALPDSDPDRRARIFEELRRIYGLHEYREIEARQVIAGKGC